MTEPCLLNAVGRCTRFNHDHAVMHDLCAAAAARSVPVHHMASEEHGGEMFAGIHCPSPRCAPALPGSDGRCVNGGCGGEVREDSPGANWGQCKRCGEHYPAPAVERESS